MSDFSTLRGMRKKKEAARSFVVVGDHDAVSGSGRSAAAAVSDEVLTAASSGLSAASPSAVSASTSASTSALTSAPTSASASSLTDASSPSGFDITVPTTTISKSNDVIMGHESAASTSGTSNTPSDTNITPTPTPTPASNTSNTSAFTSTSTLSTHTDTKYDTQGLYRDLPAYLEIRQTRERGRGVWTREAVRAGQTLLSIKPHSTALSNDNLNLYCAKCCAPQGEAGQAQAQAQGGQGQSQPLMRCTGCRVVQYCDAKCQAADWAMHKFECARLQTWMAGPSSSSSSSSSSMVSDGQDGFDTTTTIPGDAVRCLGRILARKKKLGRDSVWLREIDALGSHRTSIAQNPASHDAQLHSQLAHAVVRFLGIASLEDMREYGIANSAELVDVVSQFTTNTFTLATPALAPLGVCVSPLVALFNHSCEPNAVVVFPRDGKRNASLEPMMHVVAIRDIKPGEEVLTAYIDTTLPRERRRAYLKETYYFDCDCGLCREGERGRGMLTSIASGSSASASASSSAGTVDLREAMWCPKRCGGVCWVPSEENTLTRCSRCKSAVKDTDAILDAMHVGQQALDKAEALQFTDPQKSIQLCTKLIPILVSAGLVPSAHPLLALSRLETSLLIEQLPSLGVGGGAVSTSATADAMDVEDSNPTLSSSSVRDASPTRMSAPGISPADAQLALDDTIRSATRTSTGLSHILTEGHPVRGVALAELGKLLCVDEVVSRYFKEGGEASASAGVSPATSTGDLVDMGRGSPLQNNATTNSASTSTSTSMPSNPTAQYPPSGPQRLTLALQTLLRARSELLVGFGVKREGGKVGEEVRGLIVGAEREVGVWREGVRRGIREAREEGLGREKSSSN